MDSVLLNNIEESVAELLPLFLNFFPGTGPRDQAYVKRAHSAQVDMIVCEAWGLLQPKLENGSPSVDSIREIVREAARKLSEHHRFSPSEIESAKGELSDVIFGEGPLGALYQDSRVTDIVVKGPSEIQCMIGGKMVATDVRFRSPIEYQYFLSRRLPGEWDGSWYEMILQDSWKTRMTVFSTNSGIQLCLRIPRLRNFQMMDFLRNKTLPPSVALWLSELVSQGEANILVVGPPRTGKTSLLQTFLELIDPEEVVCLLEHLPEIGMSSLGRDSIGFHSLDHSGGLGTLAKSASGGRVVVGELDRNQGIEVFLKASQLGFRGNMGSMLAADASAAIEACADRYMLGRQVDHAARRIVKGVDVIVELGLFDRVPRLSGIYELEMDDEENFRLMPIVSYKGFIDAKLTWEIESTASRWLDRIAEQGCHLEPGRYLRLADHLSDKTPELLPN